ncbi:MAG: alpha/beta hydrolase-fold protein [Planctomyces sp.]
MLNPFRKLFSSPSDSQFQENRPPSRWTQETLDGRRLDVFSPPLSGKSASGKSAEIRGVVLFLHGHGQVMLDQNPVFTKLFQEQRLAVVAPHGGKSWWLDVICPEFDSQVTPQKWLLQQVIPWISERFGVESPRIALLGVSMGGQGVLQISYRHAGRFPVVAAISPAVDFYQLHGSGIPLDSMFPDAESARQASVVLHLHPLAWPRFQFFCCDPTDHEWFDGCARLGMKLSSSGVLHERDFETVGGGHTWDYFNQMAEKSILHIAKSLDALNAELGIAADLS